MIERPTSGSGTGRKRHALRRIVGAPFLLAVRAYRRFVSPWTPATCRFTPTCSAYAEEALVTLSLPRALLLVTWRLLRCQPFCRGGYDPVPTDVDPISEPPRRD